MEMQFLCYVLNYVPRGVGFEIMVGFLCFLKNGIFGKSLRIKVFEGSTFESIFNNFISRSNISM